MIGLIVVIGLFVYLNTDPIEIDSTQYDYTDDEVQNPDAEFTIEKFSDFQCPYCAQTAPDLKQIREDYDVNVEYRHFPLTSIHPYAQSAAEAAECARDQNKFWAYHDVLFDNIPRYADNYLYDYAEALNLNMNAFETCLENREKQIVVTQDYQEGIDRGVTGTPALFLDGEAIEARSYVQIAALLQ